jgi:hypothetical protein
MASTPQTSNPQPTPAWGTSNDLLVLSAADAPHEAGDRDLITERIAQYAWGFDERRADLLAGSFTEHAVWHGNLGGLEPVPPVHGRDQIVAWLSAFWDRQNDQRRHMMMSTQIDNLTATSATVVTSLLLTSMETELRIVLTSFYLAHLVRQNDEWLIDDLFEGGDVPF